MTDNHDDTAEELHTETSGLSLTRRGMLAASALGLGMTGGAGAAAAQSSKHGEGAPFAELAGIHEADPDADDIGTEIMRIHDEEAEHGDGIYVPPGEYHNQYTPIRLSKSVALFSTGDNMHSPGAKIYKQNDIVSLETTYQSKAQRNRGGAHEITGLRFSGEEVDDSSHGVVFHSVVNTTIWTEHHGGHGCFFENSDDDLHMTNWAEARVRSMFNEGDGVRIENTAGNVLNINGMRLEIYSAGNEGDGVKNRDGYNNRFFGDSSANGGKGWNIGGQRQFGIIRNEVNGEQSTFPCELSMFHTLTPVDRIDLSSVPESTQIQFGGRLYNGTNVAQGDINLGGGDLTNVAKYSDRADAPNDALFFDTSEWAVAYKDSTGTVHSLSPGDIETPSFDPDETYYEIANKTIAVDGDLETGRLSRWNLDEDGDLVEIEEGGSIGGDLWLSWDADNLYLQASVDDPVHRQPYEPGNLFRGDCIQLGVAPVTLGTEGWEEFLQYTLALNDDGTQVYGQILTADTARDPSLRDFDAQIIRDDDAEVTRYQAAVPWTDLDVIGGFDPSQEEYLGIDWAVLDVDSERHNVDRYVRWIDNGSSAVTGYKEPDMLKAAQLMD